MRYFAKMKQYLQLVQVNSERFSNKRKSILTCDSTQYGYPERPVTFNVDGINEDLISSTSRHK